MSIAPKNSIWAPINFQSKWSPLQLVISSSA